MAKCFHYDRTKYRYVCPDCGGSEEYHRPGCPEAPDPYEKDYFEELDTEELVGIEERAEQAYSERCASDYGYFPY